MWVWYGYAIKFGLFSNELFYHNEAQNVKIKQYLNKVTQMYWNQYMFVYRKVEHTVQF